MPDRIDETWHRLRDWTLGQAPSERLAAQLLIFEGFKSVDPSHPLGGRDRGKDAFCEKDGTKYAMAVYFPRGEQKFTDVESKFLADISSARTNDIGGFVFVTNQEIRLAERSQLKAACSDLSCEIFHLERVATILDSPQMHEVRAQFLSIDYQKGGGGKGGSANASNGAIAIGGRGGFGTKEAMGGHGGDAIAEGAGSLSMGGDGGNAGTPDGRGGRRTMGPGERANKPTWMWRFGFGGAGANNPEYERRLEVLCQVRKEYLEAFPGDRKFIDAGVDQVTVSWVNKRLEELGESWRVQGLDAAGYVMPDLPKGHGQG
jgi:hypothetical protein